MDAEKGKLNTNNEEDGCIVVTLTVPNIRNKVEEKRDSERSDSLEKVKEERQRKLI